MQNKNSREKNLGFSLIELMITVIIVGVLATLAVIGYTSYIKNNRIVEAYDIIGEIQRRQETYYEANHHYCDVNTDGNFYPNPADAAFTTKFDNFEILDWSLGTIPPLYNDALGMDMSAKKTYFAYKIIAGEPANDYTMTAGEQTTYGFPALGGGTRQPWFYVVAQGNMEKSVDTNTEVRATSYNSKIIVINKGD